MLNSEKLTTEVYVPVLNENRIKRISHWDIGPVNNDWHLHRNYYQHIQDVLQSYQDTAGSKYRYFNVLRFFLEDCRLENNEDIDSISLGLIIHAWQQMILKKMKYHIVCITGDLYNADKDFFLKCVRHITEKFDQFINSVKEQGFSQRKKICFICVTSDDHLEKLNTQLKNKLTTELGPDMADMIDVIIFKQDDKLDQVLELLVIKQSQKKRIALLLAGFIVIVVLAAVVYLFQPRENKPTFLLLDNMESGGWMIDSNHRQSNISTALVPGRSGNGLEISYELLNDDSWVLVFKNILPEILTEATGIQFYFLAKGAAHSLEFKLVDNEGTTFGYIQHRATANTGWTSLLIHFDELFFWWFGEGCKVFNNQLDLTRINTLHIAISNKKDTGDLPGAGRIIIDDMYLLIKQ